MGTVNDEIRKNLILCRKEAGLTQKQLAERIGVKNNTISQWENGVNKMDTESLHAVACALGVPVAALYGECAGGGAPTVVASDKPVESWRQYVGLPIACRGGGIMQANEEDARRMEMIYNALRDGKTK